MLQLVLIFMFRGEKLNVCSSDSSWQIIISAFMVDMLNKQKRCSEI